MVTKEGMFPGCLAQHLASGSKWISEGHCCDVMCVGTAVSMEHCGGKSVEHCSKSVEHCSKRECVL